MNENPATAFVIDDDRAVRNSLVCLLRVAGIAVKAYSSAEDFLTAYRMEQAGCVILDVRMPGMDGLQLQRHLIEAGHRIPVIMLTAHANVQMAVGAMRSGAIDFLQKPFNGRTLIERVRDAIQSDVRRRRMQDELGDLYARFSTLTPRENEILELMVEGEPTKAIAARLGSSQHTVQNQRTSIFRKLQADSVVDVVRMVLTYRLRRPGTGTNLPEPQPAGVPGG